MLTAREMIPRIASLTHGLMKTCMKKPHFHERGAGASYDSNFLFFPILDLDAYCLANMESNIYYIILSF